MNLPTNMVIKSFGKSASIESITFSPNGRYLAIGDDRLDINIIDIHLGKNNFKHFTKECM